MDFNIGNITENIKCTDWNSNIKKSVAFSDTRLTYNIHQFSNIKNEFLKNKFNFYVKNTAISLMLDFF